MTYTKDVYYVTFQDVVTAAAELVGYDVWRQPQDYILLCAHTVEAGMARQFPDNPHGYNEAITWMEELAESVKDE
jgi:hypothetical protein